ncbi:uncharacterized protein K452DRAFT_356638 [Aplosporella prunicola CBS 121167]|uniref:Uncharacterized protein n=1 Tax=Aplosporella prunicola CBS 121167 TaxID=1176127 RepID=A0A6A6BM09_9PEZI|nr:uncharacterized protein K452DRAFT_356638 [Aplosporella prunicola CBS 121167]KAF2144443.1 hypothetical protein K452DRAFT_356638 [Aplosporella prunicola CBS 121167]
MEPKRGPPWMDDTLLLQFHKLYFIAFQKYDDQRAVWRVAGKPPCNNCRKKHPEICLPKAAKLAMDSDMEAGRKLLQPKFQPKTTALKDPPLCKKCANPHWGDRKTPQCPKCKRHHGKGLSCYAAVDKRRAVGLYVLPSAREEMLRQLVHEAGKRSEADRQMVDGIIATVKQKIEERESGKRKDDGSGGDGHPSKKRRRAP